MNMKQKKVIWIGLIIFILMGLFPPWVSHYERFASQTGTTLYKADSYGFILFPPSYSAWVDLSRLIPQWLMLSVLTAWIVYLKRDQKPEKVNQ